MTPRTLYVTSATAGLTTRARPVGGGVAVLEELLPALAQHGGTGWQVVLVRPAGARPPGNPAGVGVVELEVPMLGGRGSDTLLTYSELAYAKFAVQWERALAAFFERCDPRSSVVLANDVSEGPPFAELERRGFAQLVIYHVVVGEFFAQTYLRLGSLGISASLAGRAWRGLERLRVTPLAPRVLRLVWEKEAQAVRAGHAIVPSAVDPERFVLLTLSRISREKRLELAIDALAELERRDREFAQRLVLVVVGGPAYMGGASCARRLERRAARLTTPVVFPGYIGDERKWEILAGADLFLSTSRYEAYGLGSAQALASGTPVVATDHAGARAILTEPGTGSLGWIAASEPAALARAVCAALDEADRGVLDERRARAVAWGRDMPFSLAAERVAALVDQCFAGLT